MGSSVQTIDYIVLVCYLLLMAGVGAFFMRFMRVGTDFLKGGNRVEWWVAGMASFMSGFSVWTFTGGAGFAYRQGVIGVFLMALAVPAFLFGYIIFAERCGALALQRWLSTFVAVSERARTKHFPG